MRNTPEALRHEPMRARKSAGSVAGSSSFSKVSFGWRFETTARASIFSPLSVTTPAARPFATRISATAESVRMSTPAGRAGARHRLGDRAHAADRVAPDALPAVGLAEAMVQQHVGGARRVGAGVGSDDAVEAEDRLDRIAFEPLVEKIAGRAGEDLDEIALALDSERTQAVGDPRRVEQFAQGRREAASGRHIGRRLERDRAQDVGHALEPRLVGVERSASRGREFRDLGLRAPGRRLQIAPVGQGQEVGERPLDDPQAVAARDRGRG